jgi:hypothetical protein
VVLDNREGYEAAQADLAREAGKLPGDAQRLTEESAERMAVIERLAGVLADPSDDRECDCHGEGIDQEGDEWTLCECVLRRIGDLPVVRDTEREHEQEDDAEHIVIGDSPVTLCGQGKAPLNCAPLSRRVPGWGGGCWTCLTLAREAWEAIGKPHHDHADVLAKALDRFFGYPAAHGRSTMEDRAGELREAVEPTLRALGYPKEETA